MANAAFDRKNDHPASSADESGARPIWKHLDELEGSTPIPLSARERADVDELLREIGTGPNPDLQPPAISSTAPPRATPSRRFLGMSAFTLTILGAAAFMFGMLATTAALDWNRDAGGESNATAASTKGAAASKRMVVLQLPPFTITAQLPSGDVSPADGSEPIVGEQAPTAAAAAAWHPPQLAASDAPPIVTPMGVARPASEPSETVALSDASDEQVDAVIAGLAAPAPSEALDAPIAEAPAAEREEQHALFTPPVPASTVR